MGWSLEDGKDTFIPQWKAGDIVRNLVAEDGGEITLYAAWDDCPWIQAQDLYYTLEQAQSGFITEEEILSHATATDREDGSPILPGTNPAPSDPEVLHLLQFQIIRRANLPVCSMILPHPRI